MIVFLVFLFLIVYCYAGYPLAVWAVSQIFEKPVRKSPICPDIAIVVAAWNEQDVMEQKIRNLLSLDYPVQKMEIWIGSDGSTDRTEDIVRSFSDDRVKLLAGRDRRGKPAMLNDVMSRVQAEIVVFTDARQTFDPQTVRELVANFSDPSVGCASGELMFREKEGATAKGVNLYWNYEKFLRRCESRIHSILGATGAIYAIRRSLFSPVPDQVVLDDMFVPFQIIRRGYRSVFDETAKAYDDVAANSQEEHRRKARTLFGNYQIFGLFPDLFFPWRSPIAIQLFSHKFLRVVAPFLLIAIFVLNLFLLDSLLMRAVAVLQIVFYTMALTGGLARNRNCGILSGLSRLCYAPYVFCLLNFS
ncbi:MAG: glycosyltransferase family 2 protein, partial [Candidatus Omnitrophota bacterium]|nr:glycosyltransferase family 2 protein [Candidatus Omnitrophota bacterium]